MPWARIPPDKLINLPLFGIDVIADDGDFVWMSGPRGRMRVDKRAPRVFFEDASEAKQAGATAIRSSNEAEANAAREAFGIEEDESDSSTEAEAKAEG